ncbi:hypothetical protein [Specibacter cremeus]|uniref:hypothetical protein n=1 Tax=Specibacter cremeus TaxID=1629051 RepID=UPI001F0C765C|nr:hypothetical protein [Specibacter cremeus]
MFRYFNAMTLPRRNGRLEVCLDPGPDDVHDALVNAAARNGLSLTGYLKLELERVARRSRMAESNTATIRETRDAVAGHVGVSSILDALDEGRAQ